MARVAHRSRGQALAEFAIAVPVFLLILMVLFDFGRAAFIYSSLTNAAREGARLAAVNQDPALILERAQRHAFASSISTPAGNVVAFYRELPWTDDVERNQPCEGTTSNPMARGCVAVVEVETAWTPITPIIGSIVGPIQLSARSQLPVEFVCPNPEYDEYATSDLCPKQPS